MSCGPIIQRELRAEARRPFNYWLRVLGAGAITGAFGLTVLIPVHSRLPTPPPGNFLVNPIQQLTNTGARLFGNLNATLFPATWILVPLLIADCLSREKREGTLGLMFLTKLRAQEIVLGKSLVHGLRALTLFVTMAPTLALPMLFGGVSLNDCLMALLLDASAVALALAAGLLASSFNREWAKAVIWAEALSLAFAVAFMSLNKHLHEKVIAGTTMTASAGIPPGTMSWAISARAGPDAGYLTKFFHWFTFNTNLAVEQRAWFQTVQAFPGAAIPQFTAVTQTGLWNSVWTNYPASVHRAWFASAGKLLLLSILVLLLTMSLAGRCIKELWRDKPPSTRQLRWRAFFCSLRFWKSFFHRRMTRLLERNPVGWLQQYSWNARLTKWSWCIFVLLVECVFSESLSDLSRGQDWLVLLLLGGIAMSAAGSFRRELETGALELLLVTPLRVSDLITGRMRGIWMQFLPSVGLMFVAMYVTNAMMFWGRRCEEMTLLIGGYVILPVVGLYFSLTRKTLLTSWLGTCGVGVLLPWFLSSWLTRFLVLFTPVGPLHALGPPQDVVLLVLQGIVGAAVGLLLHQRLAHRRFVFTRFA
jgi:ABC-type transport system involved in multi-copper enzyme maturation permease subunit